MTDLVFVDTNVLLYRHDSDQPEKQRTAAPILPAAAQSAKCRFLLTEDLQHGQDLDGVTVMNPFLNPPRGNQTSEVHEP